MAIDSQSSGEIDGFLSARLTTWLGLGIILPMLLRSSWLCAIPNSNRELMRAARGARKLIFSYAVEHCCNDADAQEPRQRQVLEQ